MKSILLKNIPKEMNTYVEPFLGGGTLFLTLQPRKAILSDINPWLVLIFKCILSCRKKFITRVRQLDVRLHNAKCTRNVYEKLVKEFNTDTPSVKSIPHDISHLINHTALFYVICKKSYGGNVKFDKNNHLSSSIALGQMTRDIINEVLIDSIYNYMKTADIKFMCGDYITSLRHCKEGDFVYLDPPYFGHEDSKTINKYHGKEFLDDQHDELKKVMDTLTKEGCKVMLSNSFSSYMEDFYQNDKKYKIKKFLIRRPLNNQKRVSSRKKSGKFNELLIMNY